MILLDTHTMLWVAHGHQRAAPIIESGAGLYVSPAVLLELQLLVESGRLRRTAPSLEDVAADSRWSLDDPPAARWFEEAWPLTWARDPFDRLIVAHARLRRWRLATADAIVLAHMEPREVVAL